MSKNYSIGDTIWHYNPFQFDIAYNKSPTHFEIQFIAQDLIKYHYQISFSKEAIVFEKLDFYPNGQAANLFERDDTITDTFHTIKLGKSLKNKNIRKISFINQLYLSKFLGDIPHTQLSLVAVYINRIIFRNSILMEMKKKEIHLILKNSFSDEYIQKKLLKLLQNADIAIENIRLNDNKNEEKDNNLHLLSQHNMYSNGQIVGSAELLFEDESTGTQELFNIGIMAITSLETGTPFFVDELNNNLHPKLSKMLIQLFHDPESNPKNAQLIFTTHETTLLSKENFRKDQIWFTQKNIEGATELYSAQDFDGVRDDIPFDKWYMAGKFGAIPRVKL
jgi:AAA15 family ATPase/GTPase